MNPEELKPGDHILIHYGFGRSIFYVLENMESDQIVIITKRCWLVSGAIFLRYTELLDKKMVYLGRGKKRWWRNILLPIKDLLPAYSNPYPFFKARDTIN